MCQKTVPKIVQWRRKCPKIFQGGESAKHVQGGESAKHVQGGESAKLVQGGESAKLGSGGRRVGQEWRDRRAAYD